MLPTLRQRLVITISLAAAAALWLLIVPAMRAQNLSAGLSIIDARVGLAAAAGLMLAVTIPCAALAALTSSTGHPLSGVFSICSGLALAAWAGGPMDGWFYRHELPIDYRLLIGELIIWSAWLLLLIVAVQRLRPWLQLHLPWLGREGLQATHLRLGWPDRNGWLSGLVCLLVGGVLSFILIRQSQPEQVIWSLLLAFCIGALSAQIFVPSDYPLPMLLAPAVLAAVAYLYVMFKFDSTEAVLAAWYDQQLPLLQRLPGLALALPMHYISAAVAGVCVGVGWGQELAHDTRERTATAAAA